MAQYISHMWGRRSKQTARMQTGVHKRPKVAVDANEEEEEEEAAAGTSKLNEQAAKDLVAEERRKFAEAKRELRDVMRQYHIAQAHTAYIREELRKAEAAEAAADALRRQAEHRLLDLPYP